MQNNILFYVYIFLQFNLQTRLESCNAHFSYIDLKPAQTVDYDIIKVIYLHQLFAVWILYISIVVVEKVEMSELSSCNTGNRYKPLNTVDNNNSCLLYTSPSPRD